MPIPIDDNQPWWRYRRVEDKGQLTLRSALKKRADDILARPNARFPNGSFNPRVVSREDARIVSQAYPRVAEQQGRPGEAITGFEALGNLGGRALVTGLEAISETGLAGTQALADIGPNFPAPLSFLKRPESELRSRESFQTVKRAITGKQPLGEAVTELAQRQRERPLPEQFAAGAVFDPLNVLPGVGWGPEIARGTRAVVGAARRGAEEALVRAPGRVLPEAGLRLAGAQGVAGGAPTYSKTLQQAFKEARASNVYTDARGSYRLKSVEGRTGSMIAPWNKEARATFANPDEFHKAATRGYVAHQGQFGIEFLRPAQWRALPLEKRWYEMSVEAKDGLVQKAGFEPAPRFYHWGNLTTEERQALVRVSEELTPTKPVAPVAEAVRPTNWTWAKEDMLERYLKGDISARDTLVRDRLSMERIDINKAMTSDNVNVRRFTETGAREPVVPISEVLPPAPTKPVAPVAEAVRPARGGVVPSRQAEAAGGAGSVERQRRRAEMMDVHARNLRQAYEDMVARGAPEDEFQEMLSPLISVPLRKGETWKARAEALVVRGEVLAQEASAEVAGVTPSTRAVPESIVSPATPGRAVEQGAVVSSSTAAAPPPPVITPEESTAAGVSPPPAAAPPGGRPPIEPPTTAGAGVPPADPIQSRPRTLLDMNREAKGMRAMTPEQRASVMDLAKPIEGDILYQARPFNEHAQNLLGPDTNFMKALRRLPGLKQVYGVWNPAQMARDNPQAMIGLRQSIFQEIEKARIRFVTLRWWHEADNAFEFKQFETAYGLKPTTGVWRATKVQSAPGVVRGKMFGTFNDMIEHPERYVFTDDQTKVLYLADNTLTQSVRDAQRAGVNVVEIAEEYWPRIVTKGPKGEKGFGIARKRVSSAKGYTRQRAFSDIDDLVAAGYTVETDPRRVLASRLEAGVDTIAHANSRKQIAALPGVEKPLERMERRFPQVLESARGARAARDAAKVTVKGAGEKVTTEQVMALRQAEADYITAMREVFAKKVEAGMPGYYELRLPNGRIAPQELVDQVGKLIDLPELRQAGEGAAARLTQEVSQLLRTTLTNVDTAAGFIQGQSLFYRNNIVWWKAQMQAGLALLDDPTAFVVENFDLMDEGVRTGTIVAPTEYLFAKQGIASIPLRIPYIGPGLGAFNRVFEWFITAGQTYLYKAARSGVAKNAGMDELVSLGSAIRKEVGTESYAILGVRPNQRTFEALSLFAARFFRANVGLLGQSFTPGPGGAEARKAVGSLLAGGMAVTIGIKWAQDRELPNMTDPYAPDWMQWRWGKTYHNAYGPFYPYLRTMARVSVSLGKGNPMKAAGEIKRFLTSKESLPLRAIDIAGQLIYYGSANVYGTKIEKQWLSIVKGILSEFVTPISLQEIPSGIAEGRPESVLEFGGLIGRPVRMASEWAKDLQSYWDIPTSPLELKKGQLSREKYREANPEVDAKLFITGAVSSLIARKSNFTGMTIAPAVDIALALIRENDINPDDIRGITARKKLLAEYRKAGLDPPESRGVDRLIVLLGQTPSSTSQQPMPTPSTSGTGSSTWERMKQPATTPSSSSTWERMKQSTSKSPSSSVWDRMKQSATPVGVR